MSVKATSDLWWKNAIVYCLDVETYLDSNGDGCGDLVGTHRPRRLPRRPGRELRVAHALLPLGQPRRRLRHRRLLRRRPGARDARRLRRVRAHGPRPRHPRDRRPRRQPHLRPASLVPVGALQPRLALPRLLRLGRREAARRSRATSSSPTSEESNWAWDEAGRPVLPAPLLLPPARPQRRQPRRPRRARPGHGLLDRAGPVGLPRRRGAVPDRADRPARGRDRRSPRAPARPARRSSTAATARRCCSGEVNLPAADQRAFLGDEDGDELHMVFDFLGNQALYLSLARGDAGAAGRHAARVPGAAPDAPRWGASCATTTSSRWTS